MSIILILKLTRLQVNYHDNPTAFSISGGDRV